MVSSITTIGILAVDIIAVDLPRVAELGHTVFSPRGIKLSVGGHLQMSLLTCEGLAFEGR